MAADPTQLKAVQEISRQDILFRIVRVPQPAGAEADRVVVASSDFQLHRLDLSQDKPQDEAFAGHESYVTALALAGQTIVSGSYDTRLIFWDAQTMEQVRAVPAHERWIRNLAASPDGRLVASVADDMVCRLWDAETGQARGELRGHEPLTPHHYPSMLYTCAFSPDGKHLATGDRVGHVVVWEVETGKQLAALEAPVMYTWDPRQRRHSIGGVRSLAFSPDGQHLAVGGMGQVGNIDHLGGKARVEVFDWRQGQQTCEFGNNQFNGLVERLAFHPGGDWLLAAGGDNSGFFLFFDLAAKKAVVESKAPMHVHDALLSGDADRLYAVGHNRLAVFRLG